MEWTQDDLVERARQWAVELRMPYIGDEHILLALISLAGEEGLCWALGLEGEWVKEQSEILLGGIFTKPVKEDDVPLMDSVRKLFEVVRSDGEKPGGNDMAERLLSAMVEQEEGLGGGFLRDRGITVEKIRATREQLLAGVDPLVLRAENRMDEWDEFKEYSCDRWVAEQLEQGREYARKQNEMFKQRRYEDAALFRDMVFEVRKKLVEYVEERGKE